MGLFTKDKITLDFIADLYAREVFISISDKSLEKYKFLLKNLGESEEIDERQEKEIMMFDMFRITRVIQKVFNNQNVANAILDKLYTKVYEIITKTEKEKTPFEEFIKFVNKRNEAYCQWLSPNSVSWGIGKQFADFFLNKDVKGLAFIHTITDIFFDSSKAEEHVFKTSLSDFEFESFGNNKEIQHKATVSHLKMEVHTRGFFIENDILSSDLSVMFLFFLDAVVTTLDDDDQVAELLNDIYKKSLDYAKGHAEPFEERFILPTERDETPQLTITGELIKDDNAYSLYLRYSPGIHDNYKYTDILIKGTKAFFNWAVIVAARNGEVNLQKLLYLGVSVANSYIETGRPTPINAGIAPHKALQNYAEFLKSKT